MLDLQPARWALRLRRRRRLPLDRGAVRRARQRRALAGRPARGLARLLAGALGAGRRRRGRRAREPGRHAGARDARGVVGRARARARRGARAAAASDGDVRRPGVARRRAPRSRATTSTTTTTGGRPTSTAWPDEADELAAADGEDARRGVVSVAGTAAAAEPLAAGAQAPVVPHSAIYACLLAVWLVPGLASAEMVFGFAHGLGWIVMVLLILAALRARRRVDALGGRGRRARRHRPVLRLRTSSRSASRADAASHSRVHDAQRRRGRKPTPTQPRTGR